MVEAVHLAEFRSTSSTPATWCQIVRVTTTRRACRCACPTVPPHTSSSSSCSGLTAASPASSASSRSSSTRSMWTTPPPCPPMKGRLGVLRTGSSTTTIRGTGL